MTAERIVSVTEAATATPRLIREAENGDHITITRQGRPVARLVPYGVAVDELATFQALMDEALQRVADARDFGRRHATTPTTEENQ